MKHAFLIGLLSLCPAFSSLAQAPQPPELAARAYLLIDISASQVLAEKAADTAVEPASLTKLMTAYLVRACSSTPKCKYLSKICSKA